MSLFFFSCRFHTTTYDLRLRPSLFVEYARKGVEGGESSFPSLFFCILLCKNGLPALAWRFSWCLHCCPLPISSPPRTSFFVCCDQLGVVREHVLLLISCVTIQTLWGHANACNRGHLLAHPRVEWVFGEKKRRHYPNLLVALLSPPPAGVYSRLDTLCWSWSLTIARSQSKEVNDTRWIIVRYTCRWMRHT